MVRRSQSSTLHAAEPASSHAIKQERLAIAAHEIRNPAQALMGLTDMLSGMALPPEAQACAKVIRQSAQAILAVVDDALDLVRLQEGIIAFVVEPFDPHALIAGTVEMLQQQAAAKRLDLAGFVDPNLPSRVMGDAARLRQVLLNLAGNAIKFTDEGGVGLSLRMGSDETLIFAVEDTGPGLADVDCSALFSAFASSDRSQGGLGIGLAVSAGIVSALGGALSAEAREGGGTRFSFALPCPPAPVAAPPPSAPPDTRPVLIVSNTPFTGPYLRAILEQSGYETALIERPERAGLWLSDKPDAIALIDGALGQRGVTVALQRAQAVGCQSIALLRSIGEAPMTGAAFGSQPWPVLRKPVSARQLAQRLAGLGQARPAADEERRPDASRDGSHNDPQDGPLALVVDDCPVNRFLATSLLDRAGYRCVAAADGIEAVDCVAQRLSERQAPFNLILLDLRMPGLDGVMTARQIRGVEALFLAPSAFLVGLSACVDPDILDEGRAAGMDDVVMKPLSTMTTVRLRDAATQKTVMPMSDMCKTSKAAARKRG